MFGQKTERSGGLHASTDLRSPALGLLSVLEEVMTLDRERSFGLGLSSKPSGPGLVSGSARNRSIFVAAFVEFQTEMLARNAWNRDLTHASTDSKWY